MEIELVNKKLTTTAIKSCLAYTTGLFKWCKDKTLSALMQKILLEECGNSSFVQETMVVTRNPSSEEIGWTTSVRRALQSMILSS
ncbi:hypothetical protein NC651_018775 [Populus alba x Populus x berolinensis]|nr:hypothetical protein NC651_018775 [Populus alba x Populus x berolinensis]